MYNSYKFLLILQVTTRVEPRQQPTPEASITDQPGDDPNMLLPTNSSVSFDDEVSLPKMWLKYIKIKSAAKVVNLLRSLPCYTRFFLKKKKGIIISC